MYSRTRKVIHQLIIQTGEIYRKMFPTQWNMFRMVFRHGIAWHPCGLAAVFQFCRCAVIDWPYFQSKRAIFFSVRSQKRQQNNMDDNELLRRCSLQEYSMVKQQQLQQQQHQQNINGKRKSVSKITELMPQSSVDSGCNNAKIKEQSRRMSTNPQDYLNGSGILTEPGSPAKPGKLLGKWNRRCGLVAQHFGMMNQSKLLHFSTRSQAGRPAPLLRRCSVPVFGKNPCKFKVHIRTTFEYEL